MKNTYEQEYRAVIDKIVGARKAKGLTQKDLADRLGLERTIYTKIETCDRRIDVIETVKICRILGLKLEDLVGE